MTYNVFGGTLNPAQFKVTQWRDGWVCMLIGLLGFTV